MSDGLAWAAGFIDGEGAIGVSRERDRRKGDAYFSLRACLQVSNTQPIALERLVEILGGGKVTAVSVRNPRHAPQWHYALRDSALLGPLEALRPYLLLKYAQATWTIAFLNSRLHASAAGRGRHAPYTSTDRLIHEWLSQLNRKGPDREVVGA